MYRSVYGIYTYEKPAPERGGPGASEALPPGSRGESCASPGPPEPFKEAIPLYAGRSQAKALLGGLTPQERPRVAITQWGNLPLYGQFLHDVGLAEWVEAVAIRRRADATPALLRLGRHPTVVTIGIYPGNNDELDVVFPLIEEAQALLGPEAIRLLLLDRGFSSG